jgi:hypothetical protein
MKKYISDDLKRYVIKDNIDVRLISGNTNWMLLKNIKIVANNKLFIIPKNFVTDFASVPKFLKPLFPNKFLYNQIAVLHDYLYSKYSDELNITREESDIILKEGLKMIDNNSFKSILISNIFYYTVKIFGKSHWKKD